MKKRSAISVYFLTRLLAAVVIAVVAISSLADLRVLHASGGQRPAIALAGMPLVFAENKGQLDPRIAYQLQGRNTAVYFTSRGMTLSILEEAKKKAVDQPRRRWNLKLDFIGADLKVEPEGRNPARARVSYFKGQQKSWRTGIQTYTEVVYPNLWPGIDLVYSGAANRLKYEFIVRPGAEPQQIKLAYRGAGAPLTVNRHGQLEIATSFGVIRDDRPLAYQPDGRKIKSSFLVNGEMADGGQAYGFSVGKYDRNQTLVIDPAILVYAGFIGGGGDDEGHSIAVDSSGNAFISGVTTSPQATFPEAAGPDLAYNGRSDAFVAKVAADGSGLVYAGYIGGDGDEAGHSIAIDSSGNAYLTGWTTSSQSTFPVVGGPGLSFNGAIDAFVAKVDSNGSSLLYCGYLGGDDQDEGLGIAVDPSNRAYLTGLTGSNESTFPVSVGPGLSFKGAIDAFVARVKADGSGFDYVGYLGGDGDDQGRGIAVDGTGNAYVAGLTTSNEGAFPMTGSLDPTFNGGTDAFVAKINSSGSAITYSGFIGGNGIDEAFDIALDGPGNAYLTGRTTSTEATFPKLAGPDLTFNGAVDAFVAKVNVSGSALVYAGYIGGIDEDEGFGIAVDGSGNAYVAGRTTSSEATFPELNGFDLTLNGPADGFLAMVEPGGVFLNYAVYHGGDSHEECFGVAVRGFAQPYLTGRTTSSESSFSVLTGPALNFGGASDAFVARIDADYYEADVAPRPNGSRTLLVSDWVQVGRFSVGLDIPAAGSEFQRADCAPRNTMGDGRITVADWVQAGRFSVGLDSILVSGGATQLISALPNEIKPQNNPREFRIAGMVVRQDEELIGVPVELVTRGGENALTFSLFYDPEVLKFQGAFRGRDAGNEAEMLINKGRLGEGQVGYGIALKPGRSLDPGVREVLVVKFKVIKPAALTTRIRIGNGVTPLDLADHMAIEIPVRPASGEIRIATPSI